MYKMEYLDCGDDKSTGTTTIYRTSSKEQIIEVDETEDIGHEIEVNEEIIDVYGKQDVITQILREPIDVDTRSNHSNTSTTNTTTATALIANNQQNTNIEIDHSLSTESIVTSSNHVTDSDERFLLSCAQSLRRLTPKQNGLARLKIQQILYEIEFGNS